MPLELFILLGFLVDPSFGQTTNFSCSLSKAFIYHFTIRQKSRLILYCRCDIMSERNVATCAGLVTPCGFSNLLCTYYILALTRMDVLSPVRDGQHSYVRTVTGQCLCLGGTVCKARFRRDAVIFSPRLALQTLHVCLGRALGLANCGHCIAGCPLCCSPRC